MKCLPLPQLFGYFCIMNIWIEFNYLLPLNVGEHHESIHGSLDMVRGVLLRLQQLYYQYFRLFILYARYEEKVKLMIINGTTL